MSNSVKSIAKAAVIITIFSSFSKLLGMVRESTLAAQFGTSFQSDAYKIAFEIPSLLFGIISGALATTFVPIYTDYVKKKTTEEIQYFVNNTFNIVVVISILLAAVGAIFSSGLIKMIAPGFKGEAYNLTVRLTLIMLPALVFLALSNLSNVYLQANARFASPAFAGIPFNLFIIASIILPWQMGIKAVAIGSLFAFVIQFLVQVPSMIKEGYRFKPVIDIKEEGFKKMSILIIPVLISTAFNQLYIIIDRMLASGLNEGSISALDYANKINLLIYNVFIGSILTVAYPSLSLISDDIEKFKSYTIRILKVIIFISLPMTAGLMVLRFPIVQVLFERGAFNQQATHVTSLVLGCFSVSILGMGARVLLNSAFYCLKDTKTPMINGVIAICVNIVLNLILVRFWNIAGLAISMSISTILSGIMLFYRFKNRMGGLEIKEINTCLLQATIGCVAMILVLMGLNCHYIDYIFQNASLLIRIIRLMINVAIGGSIYAIILHLLKVKELDYVINLLKDKLNKKIEHFRNTNTKA